MSPARPTVLIAGGGVAGLEALLMVRRLLGRRVRAVVLAPEPEFTYRQYAVAEPFSYGEVARFDLGGPGLEGRRSLAPGCAGGRRRLRKDRLHHRRCRNPLRRARDRRRAPRAPAACRARSPTAGRRAIATSTRRFWRSTEARSPAWRSPCRLPATGRCRSMSSRSWPPLTWPTSGTGRKRSTSSRPRGSRWGSSAPPRASACGPSWIGPAYGCIPAWPRRGWARPG